MSKLMTQETKGQTNIKLLKHQTWLKSNVECVSEASIKDRDK